MLTEKKKLKKNCEAVAVAVHNAKSWINLRRREINKRILNVARRLLSM